jgi:hypothetical protein
MVHADAARMSAQTLKPSKSNSTKETPAVGGSERRRSPRQQRSLPAWLSDQSAGRRPQQQRVTVTDISIHGCGFIAAEKPELGATHWIVVASENLHLSTRLRIANVRGREDGSFEVGCEFY